MSRGRRRGCGIGQGGQVIVDEEILAVAPTSPGSLVVTLVAAAPSGQAVVADLTVDVEVAAAPAG